MFRSLRLSAARSFCRNKHGPGPRPQADQGPWCTGGGSHDYKGLQPVLTKAIQKKSPPPIAFTPSTDPKEWAKKGFADKYDVLVLFFTQHDKAGKPIVANIAQTIRDGKPAVVIHGTLHSYRELNQDRATVCEAMGLTSVRHDKAREKTPTQEGLGPLDRGRLAGRLEDRKRRVVRERQVLA